MEPRGYKRGRYMRLGIETNETWGEMYWRDQRPRDEQLAEREAQRQCVHVDHYKHVSLAGYLHCKTKR